MYFLLFLFVVAFNDGPRGRVVEHDFRGYFNSFFSTRHLKYTKYVIYGVMHSFFLSFLPLTKITSWVLSYIPVGSFERFSTVFFAERRFIPNTSKSHDPKKIYSCRPATKIRCRIIIAVGMIILCAGVVIALPGSSRRTAFVGKKITRIVYSDDDYNIDVIYRRW